MVVGLQQVQGSVSQQGWLKDHRGLCHDKGTAGRVWCDNVLGDILGQLGTSQQGKSDT